MEKAILVIDHRETRIKEWMTKENYSCQYENLELGDIVIRIDDADFCVFERKTLTDLMASIVDGRYSDQKQRMIAHYGVTKIYYIIEGIFDYKNIHKTLLSSIINTTIRDHIQCLFTTDHIETCILIREIYNRIQCDPNKYILGKSYESTSKPTKRIMSKAECYISQLCQVPDISLKTAQAIAEKYPSMQDLLALSKFDENEKLKVLKEIFIKDNKGKQRRISEKVVKNILQYIL